MTHPSPQILTDLDHDARPPANERGTVCDNHVPMAAPETIVASPRIAISNVSPDVDGGRFPAKAAVGDVMEVTCDVLTDGHERLGVALRFRSPADGEWRETPMVLIGNDRWHAHLDLIEQGSYEYTIVAWRDPFATWIEAARARASAGQSPQVLDVELQVARNLLQAAIKATQSGAAFECLLAKFDKAATDKRAATEENSFAACLAVLETSEAQKLLRKSAPRPHEVAFGPILSVRVERKAAAFSAWYELMPRSQSGDTQRHGTFDDVIARLPYVRDMGFDVLYLTPIHPIGATNRKGRDNALVAGPDDPGSMYAIGSADGGHDALHPELGSFDDFERLIVKAREHGLELALDFAIQCSPDHPWIKQHPEWFDWLPDGSIRFAENPPKKYEDIVNVHFYGASFPTLWFALRDIVLFWVGKGVRIFRVDNPHTKPFPFWEWLIKDVQGVDPDVIFLSEAFTRPKIMQQLAKLGFTQSYSYFTWRNTKQDLTEYLKELTQGSSRSYMRPNFFVNTPDINPVGLQTGGRAAFRTRLILAASLGGNYGIYSGFELCEADAISGKEEYARSEKYEICAWDWDREGHIRDDIALINRLRNGHRSLQSFDNVTFYNAWNDQIIYYGKSTKDRSEMLLFAVNLDPHNPQQADFEVPLWEFGLTDHASIGVEDLITGHRTTWSGKVQHMRLDPHERPYAIWRLLPAGASS